MMMQQSVLIQPQTSRVEARPMPTVGPEDVLVEVKVCGVCASELHGWQGDSKP
jgi:D-arabinose 1-dehydrogenase-like Zn-dependent alcohol dehydrogenase